jgi:hypothetical protein
MDKVQNTPNSFIIAVVYSFAFFSEFALKVFVIDMSVWDINSCEFKFYRPTYKYTSFYVSLDYRNDKGISEPYVNYQLLNETWGVRKSYLNLVSIPNETRQQTLAGKRADRL